jgi:hypothetical protein
MTQILQCALNASVAPAGVLGCHSHDQAANLRERGGPAGTALRVGSLPGDGLPVPAENRVRRHGRGNLGQQPTTETRATDSQASSFVVGKPQTLVVELSL